MNRILYPDAQVYWYLNKHKTTQLRDNIKADVAIVGGGMAGLSAAQAFANKGYKVVLVEKYFCGSGASGKSSGFITPDSEFDLSQLTKMFGMDQGKKLWEFAKSGVKLIKDNITDFSIDCNYILQDTLIVSNSKRLFEEIKTEYETQQKLSYESTLYHKTQLHSILGSKSYAGGIYFKGSFGINAYAYCQAMKNLLATLNVKVYEESPALNVNGNVVTTQHGQIHADKIVVCVDRFLPELDKLNDKIYQAQAFLVMSEPLPEFIINKIFPDKILMVWDNDFLYQYYRLTADNRLLLGGTDLVASYWGKEQHNLNRMYNKLVHYFKSKFPHVKIDFKYFWPGLIGTSKDIMPIAGPDLKHPNIYYISCAAGLPWAAALGYYSANKLIDNRDDLDKYFSPQRKFLISNGLQTILGKRITWGLSNLITIKLKS